MADISPDLFMDDVLAYQQTAAIKAALELDLFSEIGKGNGTAEVLARRTGAAVRGVRIAEPNLPGLEPLKPATSVSAQAMPNAKVRSGSGNPD
jgi:hypothetical protein